jgi:hypothetical protein
MKVILSATATVHMELEMDVTPGAWAQIKDTFGPERAFVLDRIARDHLFQEDGDGFDDFNAIHLTDNKTGEYLTDFKSEMIDSGVFPLNDGNRNN